MATKTRKGSDKKHKASTCPAVWEVYLDPKWARQRLRLYGAQDRALEQFFNKLEEEMAELSMERHNHAKQLVVFLWPRGAGQLRGRVVLVDEHRTSRVSSTVNGKQPCEVELDKLMAPRKPPQAPRSGQAATQPAASEPGPSTPPPAKRSKPAAEPTKGRGKGKAAKAKPAPQPGRWLDRDCDAALNMQRIGESRWRSLELCYWPDQGALPAKGKEYPGLGYKWVRDKPPKAQEQQQQPAEAQLLRWRMQLTGSTAVEFGVVPEELQDRPKALHKGREDTAAEQAARSANPAQPSMQSAGICSSITVGSKLPLSVPLMSGSIVEMLASASKLSFIITQPCSVAVTASANNTLQPDLLMPLPMAVQLESQAARTADQASPELAAQQLAPPGAQAQLAAEENLALMSSTTAESPQGL
ncbi:hypothetical protein QJQ45_011528 [Haematococcus lacustris]|nr:hypothetical protein QJQ45_011528 [Haematococcus lacustris]